MLLLLHVIAVSEAFRLASGCNKINSLHGGGRGWFKRIDQHPKKTEPNWSHGNLDPSERY